MGNIAEQIKKQVTEKYISWSNNIPFAIVSKGNEQTQYNFLQFDFQVSAEHIPTEDFAIQGFSEDFFCKIQDEEILNFVKNIADPIPENKFDAKIDNIVSSVEEAYQRLFTLIGEPDVIIWSRKLCTEFALKSKQGYPPKILGNSIQSIMIKDPKQNNIFLLFKNKIDKIYPEEDKDRFVLDIKDNLVSGRNMKISGGIKHKVINCEKDEFAKITITNHM